ncbi:MAG: glycerol kinase GlpK [Chlorobi bacterium]|nr:glycerol kinase GlpK [Chlorobiota bacterium]
MKKKYILALDQGTSSSRAIIFDKDQKIIGVEQQEFKQFYPKTGRVEQNPHEIWESQFLTAKTLITKLKINPNEIAGIGITNQRETTIVWDKKTGEPIYNAIVWQDKRTSAFCTKLKNGINETYIKEQTGLLLDAYFSATKINWILNNVEGAKEKAKKGNLLFGTVDTWLTWKLSGAKLHITDYSNASRTLLFNINTLKWDKNLLKLFDVPESMLPEVKNSSELYGYTTKELFGAEIPIAGIAGDQQAALFGQQCFSPGEAKNTYGTGCFMLMNTGEKPVKSKSGLLTTIAWGIGNKITYALEGSVFMAGAAVKWLRDGIKIIANASDTEQLIKQTNSNEGVYFVPAFAGLGAPFWDAEAKGIITGLTQGVTESHIVRATVESLAYQTKDILDAMSKDSGINLKELNVDGGASVNNFLMQFQSDILNKTVIRPEVVETTAAGAAFLAGLSTGFWTEENLMLKRKIDKEFNPNMKDEERAELYNGWKLAVRRCMLK